MLIDPSKTHRTKRCNAAVFGVDSITRAKGSGHIVAVPAGMNRHREVTYHVRVPRGASTGTGLASRLSAYNDRQRPNKPGQLSTLTTRRREAIKERTAPGRARRPAR
jgi:hypothetical protein